MDVVLNLVQLGVRFVGAGFIPLVGAIRRDLVGDDGDFERRRARFNGLFGLAIILVHQLKASGFNNFRSYVLPFRIIVDDLEAIFRLTIGVHLRILIKQFLTC